jgi:hypothetical protein
MKDILDRIADSNPNESSHELICRLRDCAREIEALRAAAKQAPVVEPICATCKGSGAVDDGEITGSGGVEFENGPIKCVKDCPECVGKRQVVEAGARDEWLDEIRRAIRVYAHACHHDKDGVTVAASVVEKLLARASEAAPVPAVPVEPTQQQLVAICESYWGDGWDDEDLREARLVDARNMYQAMLGAPQPASEQQRASFQSRVRPWMLECFGAEISADRAERNHRFFEEASELVQACGMTASEAHQLVDYTWSRPIGEPNQEAGGVMVTLAALCLANGLDMHAAGETELERINKPDMVIRIRAKQAAKPKHSPLPEATKRPREQLTCDVVCEMPRFEAAMRGAFDYTPKRNPFAEVVPHAEEAYQFGRDCDRFMGWCMSVQANQHMSDAVLDVLAERKRVVEQEGFTPEHDDANDVAAMADAAACYAMHAGQMLAGAYSAPNTEPRSLWPWDRSWWKPTTPRRDLVKAAQLTIAEIERIDRAAAKEGK